MKVYNTKETQCSTAKTTFGSTTIQKTQFYVYGSMHRKSIL